MGFGIYGQLMYEYFPNYRRTVDNLIPRGVREFHDRELKYWTSPRGEYELRAFATSLPFGVGDFLGSLMRHNDAMAEMDEALGLYGLDYEDIKYPTKTLGFTTGQSVARAGMNFVSSNLGRLYR